MKKLYGNLFLREVTTNKQQYPLAGQVELTYRCNLNCVHCYCKGSEDEENEFTTSEWKKILNEIHKEGCMYLTFTGGEPLIRKDFLSLYSYAKKKGFIITIFTNGQLFTKQILDYLTKSPPYSIEISLNGITKKTYESITQVRDSFEKVMVNIKKIKKGTVPLILKSNCLKQNKGEIGKIKAFADKLLGKSDGKYHFKYDPMIYPRLNGDNLPISYRLSSRELLNIKKQDSDIWQDYEKRLNTNAIYIKRPKVFLYNCNSWLKQFFINPYGRLKFCNFSEKFSSDLKNISFKQGFYTVFPRLLNEKFGTDSKCINCSLRPICCWCPAKACLETKKEEVPIDYYCELAKSILEERSLLKCQKN